MSAPHFVVHNDSDTVGVVVVEDVKAFVETLLGTAAATEAVSAMTLV